MLVLEDKDDDEGAVNTKDIGTSDYKADKVYFGSAT